MLTLPSRVELTREHIRRGEAGHQERCPVALAIAEATGYRTLVALNSIRVLKDWFAEQIQIGPGLNAWITTFDELACSRVEREHVRKNLEYWRQRTPESLRTYLQSLDPKVRQQVVDSPAWREAGGDLERYLVTERAIHERSLAWFDGRVSVLEGRIPPITIGIQCRPSVGWHAEVERW